MDRKVYVGFFFFPQTVELASLHKTETSQQLIPKERMDELMEEMKNTFSEKIAFDLKKVTLLMPHFKLMFLLSIENYGGVGSNGRIRANDTDEDDRSHQEHC